MVEYSPQQLDAVFGALADETRRRMLHLLALGERTISELAAPFKMSLAGASKHVKVLEKAGLIRRRVEGRTHICELEATRLAEAQRWIQHHEQLWNQRLDALDALLTAEDEQNYPL